MARKKIGEVAAEVPEVQVAEVQPEPTKKAEPKKFVAESIEDFDVIDGYVLENHEKLTRVIEGEVKRAGQLEGGLIEKYGEISKIPPKEVLAYYDRLAGLITKNVGGSNRVRVATGSFWDMRKKCPRETPELMYIFNVGGTMVEVSDPAHLAAAVTTVQSALSEKETKNAERRARAKAKSISKI